MPPAHMSATPSTIAEPKVAEPKVKGGAYLSKKRWAQLCDLLTVRFGDTDTTRRTILDAQAIFNFDPAENTSSDAQRQRMRLTRQRHKHLLAAATTCPQCSQASCTACAPPPEAGRA